MSQGLELLECFSSSKMLLETPVCSFKTLSAVMEITIKKQASADKNPIRASVRAAASAPQYNDTNFLPRSGTRHGQPPTKHRHAPQSAQRRLRDQNEPSQGAGHVFYALSHRKREITDNYSTFQTKTTARSNKSTKRCHLPRLWAHPVCTKATTESLGTQTGFLSLD